MTRRGGRSPPRRWTPPGTFNKAKPLSGVMIRFADRRHDDVGGQQRRDELPVLLQHDGLVRDLGEHDGDQPQRVGPDGGDDGLAHPGRQPGRHDAIRTAGGGPSSPTSRLGRSRRTARRTARPAWPMRRGRSPGRRAPTPPTTALHRSEPRRSVRRELDEHEREDGDDAEAVCPGRPTAGRSGP